MCFFNTFFGILKTHTRRVCLMKIMGDFVFFVLSLLVLLRVAGWKILFFFPGSYMEFQWIIPFA